MRYAVIAVGALLVIMSWHGSQAATLITLSPGHSVIVFSPDELPIITQDTFPCDRHIYQADQNYTQLPNAVYHTTKHHFGVYDRCYLVPVGKPAILKSGQQVARFMAATSPYTEVVFTLTGQALSSLPAGMYTFKNGGSLRVDGKHRHIGATRP